MKKIFRLICLAAILCVAYLLLTTPREDTAPAMKIIDGETGEADDQTKDADAETDDVTDQMKAIGQDAVKQANEVIGDAVKQADEAIGDAVKRADEALDNAVEQADIALADAVDSAAEGAKQGFIESLRESASEFWNKIFSQEKE